jgi:hypothetical protein
MDVRFRNHVAEGRKAELQRWLAPQTTSGDVWAALLTRGLRIHDIVTMDEFTLDWIVPLPDGLVLVYDTT